LVPVGVSGLQDTIDSRQKAQTYTAEITANDLGGRFGVGVNALIANGYTGQTTEVLALPTDPAPFERVVGVRLASFVSGTSLLLYTAALASTNSQERGGERIHIFLISPVTRR
jgi:hypothetical protein